MLFWWWRQLGSLIADLLLPLRHGSALTAIYSRPMLSSPTDWQSVLACSMWTCGSRTSSPTNGFRIVLIGIFRNAVSLSSSIRRLTITCEGGLLLSCCTSILRSSHIGKYKADDDKHTGSDRGKSLIDITDLLTHSEWIGLPLPPVTENGNPLGFAVPSGWRRHTVLLQSSSRWEF